MTATIATYRKRKFIKKAPAKNGVLAITAIAGLIFVGVHLLDLRFGEETYVRVGNESVRDLFGLQMKLFSSPGRVLFYEAGVLAIGVHLWKGWTTLWFQMFSNRTKIAAIRPPRGIGKAIVFFLFLRSMGKLHEMGPGGFFSY